VVGAGPTGLLLAAELERRGVPCLLIDELHAPGGCDRATVVHERSLEIFEALGIVEPFIAAGVKTRGARLHSDGEVVGQLELAVSGSRYGFQLGLSEEVTEAELTRCLEAHGGHVTRGTRLEALQPGEQAVTATLARNGDLLTVDVGWVVGCDGYRSTVRAAAGIDFPGTDIAARWGVFDATVDGWTGDYDLVSVHLDVPPLIMTPLPSRRWRVYMRPTSESSDLVEEAGRQLRRYLPGVGFGDVVNPGRFRCHSRVAERYRTGRVLLAGDAAHACTPAQGHGMNTGLQDAFNLGWKLALVCRGEAGDALLDTYEIERRPVAELVAASGDAVERAHALTDPAARAYRDATIHAMLADPDSAHHEAVAESEIDRLYARSRAVAGDAGTAGVVPGVLLPDTTPVVPTDGEARPLPELTYGGGYTLLVLGGPDADPERVAALVSELGLGSPSIVDSVIGLCTASGGAQVGRWDETVAAQLGVVDVTVLAVRPDRYIGLRDDSGDAAVVGAYLTNLVA